MTTRRELLKRLSALGVASALLPTLVRAQSQQQIMQVIPSSGEEIPVIGMGSSRTFDESLDAESSARLGEVLALFFQRGGTVIDSSPMYGNAEYVLGKLLMDFPEEKSSAFLATKVWTDGESSGKRQMQESLDLFGVERLDLMQIHNLRDWRVHIKTLKDWKEQGRIRYIGITTSHQRSHADLIEALKKEPFDFVQFSYNIGNREAERYLLPLALDKGIATLVNRPFQRGALFRAVKGQALPGWTEEFDCASWGQFFLKYVVSHPGVTCAIPATSKPHHMLDNMGAGYGNLPSSETRERMQRYLQSL